MSTKKTDDFYETMNKVDSTLYEVAKVLKNYDASLNVEDLMITVYELIESNIYKQKVDLSFKQQQLEKDNTIVH